jgi:DNA repair protein RadA/Sms
MLTDPTPTRRYVCRACRRTHVAWSARCPICNSLDGFDRVDEAAPVAVDPTAVTDAPHLVSVPAASMEGTSAIEVALPVAEKSARRSAHRSPIRLSEVVAREYPRDPTGLAPLDLVLGGGLVRASAIVLGGMPGLGKSSLVMQALAGLGMPALIATGEETIEQASLRAKRIGAATDDVYIVAETDLYEVLAAVRDVEARVVVIDSIQTLRCPEVGGSPGSTTQVRECTNRIVEYGKANGIAMWLISHVTADGSIAGPTTMQHMVDVLLELEAGSRREGNERVLRCLSKNRFGATNNVGYFEITESGLVPVDADGWDEKL